MAIGNVANPRAATRARQADVGEAAFFFKSARTVFDKREARGKNFLLPAWKENVIKLQTFRPVQGHQADLIHAFSVGDFKNQTYMLKKRGERVELGHRADKLFKVIETRGCIGRFIGLPHGCIAGLVQSDLRDFGVGQRLKNAAPTIETLHKVLHRGAKFRFKLICFGQAQNGFAKRYLVGFGK